LFFFASGLISFFRMVELPLAAATIVRNRLQLIY